MSQPFTTPARPDDAGDYAHQISIAAQVLGAPESDVARRFSVIGGTTFLYAQGEHGAVVASPDGSHLFAKNAVSKEDHLQAFFSGQRGDYDATDTDSPSKAVIATIILTAVAILIAIIVWLALGDDDPEDEILTPDDPAPTQEETTEESEGTDNPITEPEPAPEPEPVPEPTPVPEPAPEPTETEDPVEEDTEDPVEEPTDSIPEEFDPSQASIAVLDTWIAGESTPISGSGFQPGEEISFNFAFHPDEGLTIQTDTGRMGFWTDAIADDNGIWEAEIEMDPLNLPPNRDSALIVIYIGGEESGIELTEEILVSRE